MEYVLSTSYSKLTKLVLRSENSIEDSQSPQKKAIPELSITERGYNLQL